MKLGDNFINIFMAFHKILYAVHSQAQAPASFFHFCLSICRRCSLWIPLVPGLLYMQF